MEPCTASVRGIQDYFVRGVRDAQMITLEPEKRIAFEPGQFMMLADDRFRLRADPAQLKWTSYSIASLPGNGPLEFVYTVKPTGGFTQHLAEHLRVGDTLRMKGPFGRFVLSQSGREKVFVATGAGIAPIMSMIRSLIARGQSATLYFGFRTSEHFLYRRELEALAGAGLALRTTASRDDPAWKGARGYVQDLLAADTLTPGAQEFYLCGSLSMIEAVKSLLKGKGFSADAVKVEQW